MKINIDEILKKFGRITSSGDFVPEIDGLRFFAVISVVLFHINEYLLSTALRRKIAGRKISF